jgi:S-adenosylmethionine hydrolase
MSDPIVTLTTDFGVASPYVAVMKGVLSSINPRVKLVDLTHQIPPQNVRFAAFYLYTALPYFPPGTIHLVVVDPGVGTERALLCMTIGGHILVAPDNGCWTFLETALSTPQVYRLENQRFRRAPVSATFHGRDILAPAAAHLSLGRQPEEFGPQVETWIRLDMPRARDGINSVAGEIVFVDEFGNLITNISAERLRQTPDVLMVGKRSFKKKFHWVRTYGDAESGTLVGLIGSNNHMEIAVVEGSAASRLKASVGTPVVVGWAR